MKLQKVLSVTLMVGAAALGTVACDNSSEQERYVAELRSTNEVPANSSAAVGRVVLLVAKDGSSAEYSVEQNNLTAGIQGGHFHRGAVGANGPVVLSFFFNSSGVATPQVSPGTTDLEIQKNVGRVVTKAQLDPILADLRAGNIYANIHTPNFPGGEIRGQMVRQN
jgi:hypothetical protein